LLNRVARQLDGHCGPDSRLRVDVEVTSNRSCTFGSRGKPDMPGSYRLTRLGSFKALTIVAHNHLDFMVSAGQMQPDVFSSGVFGGVCQELPPQREQQLIVGARTSRLDRDSRDESGLLSLCFRYCDEGWP
jgi:hypothetical protein